MHATADQSVPVPGLVSVVVPIGGVDRWLDEAVDSVLASEDVDFELVAVFNNGAEPPSGWRPGADPRVRVVLSSARLGPAGAGQAGIDAARGEFIAHLDADDRMHPGRLAAQRDLLRARRDTVLVSSRVGIIDGEGRRLRDFALPVGPDVRAELVRLNVAPHSAWMMRAATVRGIGGYDLGMGQMEDYDLLLRLSVVGPIAVLDAELTEYRLHASQLSRAVRPNGHYVRVIAARRQALGAALGFRSSTVRSARLRWEVTQWTMYAGRRVQGWLRR